MIARGGRGGLGNAHFKSSTHQAPKHAQKGEPGRGALAPARAPAHRRHRARRPAERRQVDAPRGPHRGHAEDRRLPVHDARAEPRASSTSSEARPSDERRPTIADVPGLIEGASQGAGLGHAFLRHVERTRILVHVVDGSDRDPEWSYGVIRDELEAHDPALLAKPMLVAFNKIDRARRRSRPGRRSGPRASATACPVVAISAATRRRPAPSCGRALAELLPPAEELDAPPRAGRGRRPPDRGSRRDASTSSATTTACCASAASGSSGSRPRPTSTIEESAERFQRDLARLGIDAELRRAGVEPRRHRPHRRRRARMGPRSRGRSDDPARRVVTPVRPAARGSSAGLRPDPPRPPRDRRRRPRGSSASNGSCSCRPVAAARARRARSPRPRTARRWSAWRSPTTRRSRSSRLELDRPGPSYTVDTLDDLAAGPGRRRRPRPAFILSAEAFADLPDLARGRARPRPVPARRAAPRGPSGPGPAPRSSPGSRRSRAG